MNIRNLEEVFEWEKSEEYLLKRCILTTSDLKSKDLMDVAQILSYSKKIGFLFQGDTDELTGRQSTPFKVKGIEFEGDLVTVVVSGKKSNRIVSKWTPILNDLFAAPELQLEWVQK